MLHCSSSGHCGRKGHGLCRVPHLKAVGGKDVGVAVSVGHAAGHHLKLHHTDGPRSDGGSVELPVVRAEVVEGVVCGGYAAGSEADYWLRPPERHVEGLVLLGVGPGDAAGWSLAVTD